MMEKYLNDTLRPERMKEIERIASANLMPAYLDRLQYIEDSTRAFRWFDMTKDSSYIRKYLNRSHRVEYHGEPDNKRSAGDPSRNNLLKPFALDRKRTVKPGNT